MKLNVKTLPKLSVALVMTTALILTSCAAMNADGLYMVRSAAQGYNQSTSGGTYVGTATSQSEAYEMAKAAGYSRYEWYPSTGHVFGKN
jgi:hypothetical protein